MFLVQNINIYKGKYFFIAIITYCSAHLKFIYEEMTDHSTTSIAQRLLRAAYTAAERTDEEDAFQSLVTNTRRNFRRPGPNLTPSVRGRKKKEHFSRKIFLVKLAHIDFLPGAIEQRYLKQRGLGEANHLLTISRSSNISTIKEKILSLYGNHIQNLLRMCGFRLAKCDKSKKMHIIDNISNGEDLEKQVGMSKIIIVPNADFPDDLPALNDEDDDAGGMTPRTSLSPQPRQNVTEENDGAVSSRRTVRSNSQPQSRRSFREEDDRVVSTRRTPTADLSPQPRQSIIRQIMNQMEDEDEVFDFEENTSNTNTLEVDSSNIVLPTLPEDAEVMSIQIIRSNCMHEMLNLYSDQSVVDKKLNVTFQEELGIDGGGLTKELFNIFFSELDGKYFRGEDCLVPYLDLNKMREKDNFTIIGRILEHMLLLTGTIYYKLSKITLILLTNPEQDVEESMLLDELYSYVNPYLRRILKKGIQDFGKLTTKEVEVLQDFFQSYKFFEIPTSEKFREQLCLIATEILVEAPKRLIDCMRKGVSIEKYGFWTQCHFETLLEMQKPTPNKVANCLAYDDTLTNEETRIVHYLDMYVRCLSAETVSLFVFMITGSFMMPYRINVTFNDLVGLSQRPLFSTCSNTLFLPRSYSTYQDLKNDLNACLQSEEAKIYTTY